MADEEPTIAPDARDSGSESIRLTNVSKSFGGVTAIDDVSLEIEPGTYHCLLGPNGSGKSTLLRLVLGLARPDAGEIHHPPGVLGCGFQEPNFYPGLTVRENLDVFAGMNGQRDADWIETLHTELRLTPALDRRAGDLSGGFSRKLDLALALITRPDYLLLDEPLGALDDVTKGRFLEFLENYCESGRTVFVSTHHVTAFEPFLDRVTLMYRGQILLDEPAGNIDLGRHDSLQEYYVATLLNREGIDVDAESIVTESRDR